MQKQKQPYIELLEEKGGRGMYRGKIGEKEVIIRLGKRVSKGGFDHEKIYQMVLSYGEAAFEKGKKTFCIYNDKLGVIVAEVEQNDIPVIRVDYLIHRENVYE
ncbi:hypothetical protein [Bacillus alveayuensis]|jgi:hypothetical protein|uniref:hypothetical protein n=1 Tax=Aeribacillus alveayuensis TaxID=279215 RepID=UPI000A74AC91